VTAVPEPPQCSAGTVTAGETAERQEHANGWCGGRFCCWCAGGQEQRVSISDEASCWNAARSGGNLSLAHLSTSTCRWAALCASPHGAAARRRPGTSCIPRAARRGEFFSHFSLSLSRSRALALFLYVTLSMSLYHRMEMREACFAPRRLS
jgi:hypothetical protein